MSLSEAQLGIGSELSMGNGASPEAFGTVSEVKAINFDGFQVEEVDTTHMQSPNRYREFKPTLKNSQSVTIESHFLSKDNPQKTMKTNFENMAIIGWKLELPDGTEFLWKGFVSNFVPGPVVVDNVVSLSFTIRISGAVQITYPTP